ncbi:MAG: biotin/lipoyl-containing protein, partial [Prochlorotrichaceae cyanobacterium]
MIHEVFMPALSSTMTEGKIVEWLKSPGDKVERGETVVVVESDKADMDVESFNEGFLAAVLVPAGESAPVGNTIALLAETEAEMAEAQARGASTSAPSVPAPTPAETIAPAAEPEPVPTAAVSNRVVVSPRARKLAKTLGVNLETLKGTGPHGRIVAADVEKAAGKVPTPSPVSSSSSTAIVPSAPSPVVATG